MHGKFMKWDGLIPRNDSVHLESVFRQTEPLDSDALRKSKTRVFVALADVESGEIVYKFLNPILDPVSLLMSSTTMPFFAKDHAIKRTRYFDANIMCAIPLRFVDALSSVEQTWVILTTPHGYRRQSWRWKAASWFVRDSRIKKMLRERATVENKVLAEIESRTDLIVIRPQEPLPIHWRSAGQEGLKQTLELGRKAVRDVLKTHRCFAT